MTGPADTAGPSLFLPKCFHRIVTAAAGLAVITDVAVFPFGGNFLVFGLIIGFTFFLYASMTAGMIAVVRWRPGRIVVLAATSYLAGVCSVAFGGTLWQAAAYGWGRTNVQGYLLWSPVYGLVFLLPIMAVMYWVFWPKIRPKEGRGFEVTLE